MRPRSLSTTQNEPATRGSRGHRAKKGTVSETKRTVNASACGSAGSRSSAGRPCTTAGDVGDPGAGRVGAGVDHRAGRGYLRHVAADQVGAEEPAVVQVARLPFRENLIRLDHLPEALLRVGRFGDVRVELACEASKRALDVGFVRVARNTEDLVVVTLGRRHPRFRLARAVVGARPPPRRQERGRDRHAGKRPRAGAAPVILTPGSRPGFPGRRCPFPGGAARRANARASTPAGRRSRSRRPA